MPSHWAKAHGGHDIQPLVGSGIPLYQCKPLGLVAGALPRCEETFSLSTKSWG